MHGMMLRQASAVSKAPSPRVVARRSARVSLRMQSEDDKAKASGIAFALVGLFASGFSVFAAVLAGGAAVYAAKLPEEGDKGLSDTAKQVSLLAGTYAIKAFDFVKEKDEEQGISQKLLKQVKGAVEDAKSKIEK
jgi:Mn2+/Fe2+ NRAMP family transporter